MILYYSFSVFYRMFFTLETSGFHSIFIYFEDLKFYLFVSFYLFFDFFGAVGRDKLKYTSS